MKFGQLLLGILIGGMLGFGMTRYFDQKNKQADDTKTSTIDKSNAAAKWMWPDSLDAVKAAAKNHKVVFEDSTVRVLQVILDGYKEEPIHTHKWRSIMWIAKPAVPCRIYQYSLNKKGKFVATDSVTVPHMDINIGSAGEPEGPTGIKNLGNDNGIAYRIEFKKDFKL